MQNHVRSMMQSHRMDGGRVLDIFVLERSQNHRKGIKIEQLSIMDNCKEGYFPCTLC